MSASTVPAVKAAIISLLAARPGLATTQVTWAPPTEKSDYSARSIFFGDTEQNEEWRSLGAHSREEDYMLDLVVRVYEDGDDPQAVETSAWAVREEIATAFRADPGLGNRLLQYIEIASTRMSVNAAAPQGWVAEAVCRLHCLTRI